MTTQLGQPGHLGQPSQFGQVGQVDPLASVSRDFLAETEAANQGNPVLEQIKSKGAETVLALYRLIKNALVHAIDNQAVLKAAAQAQQIFADFSATVGTSVTITFIGDTIFVCGQLMKASRAIYESGIELGRIFARSEVSEVHVEDAVSAEDFLRLAELLALSVREPTRRDALLTAAIPNLRVRRAEGELTRRENDEAFGIRERSLRLYASALMVMRAFFDSVAAGATLLPNRAKRLSQLFVNLAELGDPSFLGMTTLANDYRDDAGRAVQTCLLCVAVGRQLTLERVPLARLAMAALMSDAGRVRLAGPGGRDQFLALSEELESSVPAATATVALATGGVNVPNALRTVVLSEATWLERSELLGPLYGKLLTPLVEAQILRTVRALLDAMAPRDVMTPAKAPLDALQAVAALPDVDPLHVRLLVNALGMLPIGSVVEFETGEWGVVVEASKNQDALDRPIVKLVTDRNGRALSPPRLVDLGNPTGDRVFPKIANIVLPEQAKFNVTRTLLS